MFELTACFPASYTPSQPILDARSVSAASWVEEVRDNVQDKWPYLSLLPEQRTGEPCSAVGGVNTVVPIVVRVPKKSEGPDGNPEVALGYDVRDRLNNR